VCLCDVMYYVAIGLIRSAEVWDLYLLSVACSAGATKRSPEGRRGRPLNFAADLAYPYRDRDAFRIAQVA
jgi:hypothetical protein